MNTRIHRLFAFVLVIAMIASMAITVSAAPAYQKSGWVITCGDSLFPKKSTVTFTNKTNDTLLVRLDKISSCSVSRIPNAKWAGSVTNPEFQIAPYAKVTMTICTNLGKAGCIDYTIKNLNAATVSCTVKATNTAGYK